MAQNKDYSTVDLRVGTEAQFNAKVGTLPEGTLFGITDATVSKADLSTDLKNEINAKINKPANPTSDSAVVINSSGAISTKPLTDIAGKSEVAVSSTAPSNDEILWINPDGTGPAGPTSEVQYVTLNASSGTLTTEQLAILQANKSNCIMLNKQIYRLMDDQSTAGELSYVYTDAYNGVGSYLIRITISTRAYQHLAGARNGSKVYKHDILISNEGDTQRINITIINNDDRKFSDNDLKDLVDAGRYITVGNDELSVDGETMGLYYFLTEDGVNVLGFAYYIKTDGTIGVHELNKVHVQSDWIYDF